MQSLPRSTAAPAPQIDLGTAQHAALMRWHNREPVGDVMDALAANPHYPCIEGNPECVRFAGTARAQDGAA